MNERCGWKVKARLVGGEVEKGREGYIGLRCFGASSNGGGSGALERGLDGNTKLDMGWAAGTRCMLLRVADSKRTA